MASAGVVTMQAAAPSDTPQQSKRPSGSATIGAFSNWSSVILLRKCALGFRAPLSWLLTETCAMARFISVRLTRRSEEQTSELQSPMRISYTVYCLKQQIEPTIVLSNVTSASHRKHNT